MPRFAWRYAAITTVYCVGIFFISAQSSLPDRAPSWLDWPGADKVAHFIVYAGLALVVYIGLMNSNTHVERKWRCLIPVLFATMYGVSDEFHQRFVPNRSFDMLDLLVDAAGATIVVAAVELWRRFLGGSTGTPARWRRSTSE